MVGGSKPSSPKCPKSTNKGVHANVPPDNDETETSCSCSTQVRSLTNVREELQTVLDLMGNSTPHLTNVNSSSEADNEESVSSRGFAFISSKETEPLTETSERERSDELSSSTVPTLTCDSSKDTSKATERKNVNNKGQSRCKCIDTEMYMKGAMVSIPVQMSSPKQKPPATVLPSMPCAIQTERACACFKENGFSPYAEAHRSSRAQMPKRRSFLEWVKDSYHDKLSRKQPCQLYKINIEQAETEGSPPRRLIFDMVDGIPKPDTGTVATNTAKINIENCGIDTQSFGSKYGASKQCHTKYAYSEQSGYSTIENYKNYKNEKNSQQQKKKCKYFPSNINMVKRSQESRCFDSQGDTRVDFYYFDHGNAQYLHTTDAAPVLYCEVLAEKTEQTTTRFWAEIFTTMHIATAFIISFFLQFFKFLLYSIFRPVMVGGIQLLSDYLVKPFLTTFFNGIIQPLMIFLYNVATSLRDLCDPLAEAVGYFCKAIAHVFRAIRLVTIKKNIYQKASAPCQME